MGMQSIWMFLLEPLLTKSLPFTLNTLLFMSESFLMLRLTATLSLFSLRQRNTLYNAGITGEPNRMVPIGEELSRGVEVDVAGKILPFWSVMASYSYNVAEITKAAEGTKDLNLQRPGTPRHSANVWTKFVIPQGALEGLGLGFGVHGVSERLGQVGRRDNVVSYPGYALVHAALYYKIHV